MAQSDVNNDRNRSFTPSMYKTRIRGHTTYQQHHRTDVVANRGEDLRFPISSSSGFSSPFYFLTRRVHENNPMTLVVMGVFLV